MCGDARATWEDADASLYRSTYKFEMSQQIEVARMVETMDKQGGQEVGGRDGHTFQGRTHGWVRRKPCCCCIKGEGRDAVRRVQRR
jgi:hypothetical protein